MTFEIPEDLRTVCILCNGSGSLQGLDFRSAGEMDANNEPKTHAVTCRACRGKGWLWALDLAEMAERIGALRAKVAKLKAPINDEECKEFDLQFRKYEVNALIAARGREGE